jgi:prolyl-tRNA synthetase
MRYTTLFAPTLRDVSAEVEMVSQRLLLRAGGQEVLLPALTPQDLWAESRS